jgi:hypothetical protein
LWREDLRAKELQRLGPIAIRVADDREDLPPREMLEAKLHEAIRLLARGQVWAREELRREGAL